MLRIDQIATGSRTLVDETGATILARCHLADRPAARAVGLLGTRRLAADEGLWITPCASVHMFGMRYPIACLFLDGDGRVIDRRDRLAPWRTARARGARSVVEGVVGAFDAVSLGTRLRLVESVSAAERNE